MRGYPPDLIDLAESGLVSQPSGLVRAALLSAVHGDISFREKLHIGIISSMVSGVPATANNRECLLQVETTERGATVEATLADLQGPSMLSRTATSTGWIVGWRMATRLFGLISTLILVRLLAPGDFGLVALGTSFIGAVDMLSGLGVEDALVREHAPTRALYDTAFTLTAIRSVGTSVVIALAAVPVAAFFGEPRLADVLWALAAGTLIGGIASIGVIDFRRDMAFEKEFLLQILPRIISVAVTIGVAMIWHSYWALIAGILTARAGRTVFSYRMHVWRPRFTLSAWRHLIGFSLWSWALSMAGLVRDRIDMFVVGRLMAPTAVGVYAIGEEVAALPTTELVAPLCRACFSSFAAARRAGQGIEEAFMRPVAIAFMITFPAGLGISLLADPLVRLIMGEKWAPAIPIIELLGVMGALAVFGLVAATALAAFGMLRQQFTITLSCLVPRLALLVLLVGQFGILGAAIGALSGMVFEHCAFMVLMFRHLNLNVVELVRRIWRPIIAAAVMAAILVAAGAGWTQATGGALDLVWTLAGASALGAAVYALALVVLWWLSGRPKGPESDVLTFATRLVRRLSSGSRRSHDGRPNPAVRGSFPSD
jgi:lipopolysaccharide exporter